MNERIDQRIEIEFKKIFQKLLLEGSPLSFEQLIDRVCTYLEVSCSEIKRQYLKSWYEHLAEQKLLSEMIERYPSEEIVFYGHELICHDHGQIHESILNEEDFILAWTQLAFKNGVSWNHAHPFASFKANLADKDQRITLIHPSLSPDQSMRAFVRSKVQKRFMLSDFCEPEQGSYLQEAVRQRKNILCVGATKSGKTTLMETLIEDIDPEDHVIVLEDVHEIKRQSVKTTYMLAQANDANKSLSEYCAMALRMSPDRIVLGEIRSKEVIPLLLAFNCGHRGGLTSLHADSVDDGLERLCLLFQLYSENAQLPHQKVMELVCKNIDLVVFVKDKKVEQISQIKGSESGKALFEDQFNKIPSKYPLSGHENIQDWWKKTSAP